MGYWIIPIALLMAVIFQMATGRPWVAILAAAGVFLFFAYVG